MRIFCVQEAKATDSKKTVVLNCRIGYTVSTSAVLSEALGRLASLETIRAVF